MLLTAPDCFSSSPPFFSSFHNKSTLFSKRLNFKSPSKIRIFRRCKACLITSPDAFEVGRLIGSYGFMNITSYSGFQSGMDVEYSSEDMGRLRVQDVGEGSVKISSFAGFMKEE